MMGTSLSSSQLDAFYMVAKTLHFSKAAKKLGISQSALSQRVGNLEHHLGVTLFLRTPQQVSLTPVGRNLLRYCQRKMEFEQIFLSEFIQGSTLGGVVRIGGFSSVMRSLVLPSVSPLIRAHPNLQFEFVIRELYELHDLLRQAQVDFIVLDRSLEGSDYKSHFLGYEKNVLVTSKDYDSPDVYLDHDERDRTTERYFRSFEPKRKKLNRRFMDDVYGLIDGVGNGVGKAVVPIHLIRNDKRIKIIKKTQQLKFPLFLHYYEQPYYSALHKKVVKSIVDFFKKNSEVH